VIEKITSGFPDPLIDSSNQSGVFFNTEATGITLSAGQSRGCDPYAASHSSQQYITPLALRHRRQASSERFALARLRPGLCDTDFSVIKQFALPWENMVLNFRAEFYCLVNAS